MLTYNIIENFPKIIKKYINATIFPGNYGTREAIGFFLFLSELNKKSIVTSCLSSKNHHAVSVPCNNINNKNGNQETIIWNLRHKGISPVLRFFKNRVRAQHGCSPK